MAPGARKRLQNMLPGEAFGRILLLRSPGRLSKDLSANAICKCRIRENALDTLEDCATNSADVWCTIGRCRAKFLAGRLQTMLVDGNYRAP